MYLVCSHIGEGFSPFSHFSVFPVLLTNPDSSAPFKGFEHPRAWEAFWGCRYAAECMTLRLLPSLLAHCAAQAPRLLHFSGKKHSVKIEWSLGSPVSPLPQPTVFPRSWAATGSTLILQPLREKKI